MSDSPLSSPPAGSETEERLDDETERVIAAACGEVVWPFEMPTDIHAYNAISALRRRVRQLCEQARKEGSTCQVCGNEFTCTRGDCND